MDNVVQKHIKSIGITAIVFTNNIQSSIYCLLVDNY